MTHKPVAQSPVLSKVNGRSKRRLLPGIGPRSSGLAQPDLGALVGRTSLGFPRDPGPKARETLQAVLESELAKVRVAEHQSQHQSQHQLQPRSRFAGALPRSRRPAALQHSAPASGRVTPAQSGSASPKQESISCTNSPLRRAVRSLPDAVGQLGESKSCSSSPSRRRWR